MTSGVSSIEEVAVFLEDLTVFLKYGVNVLFSYYMFVSYMAGNHVVGEWRGEGG